MSSLSIEDGVRLTGGGGPAHGKDSCCPGISKKVCKILLGLFALVVFFIGFGIGFACVAPRTRAARLSFALWVSPAPRAARRVRSPR